MKGAVFFIILVTVVFANVLVDVEVARLEAFPGKERFYDIEEIPVSLLKKIANKAGGLLYTTGEKQKKLQEIWKQYFDECVIKNKQRTIFGGRLSLNWGFVEYLTSRSDLTVDILRSEILKIPCYPILPIPKFNTKPSIVVHIHE